MEHSELNIEFTNLTADRPARTAHDVLLGLQADMRIVVRGRQWFHQPMFPVVDLARACSDWLKRAGDFTFDTMEAEESPFLSISAMNGECAVYAAWEEFHVDEPLSLVAVKDELR